MSKAFQCDRCGEFFAPELMKENEKFTTIHGYGCQSRTDYSMNECWDRVVDDVHFCPGCAKDFRFFMNGGNPDDETDKDTDPDADCFSPAPPPSGLRHVIDKFQGGESGYYTVNGPDTLAKRPECTTEDSKH